MFPYLFNFSLDSNTRLLLLTSEPTAFSTESGDEIPTFVLTLEDSEETLSSSLKEIHSLTHGVVISNLPRIDLMSWASHFAIDFQNGNYEQFLNLAMPHHDLEEN